MPDEITIEGWKGHSGFFIDLEDNEKVIVHEYRKSKETGESIEQVHIINAGAIKKLWGIISTQCEVGLPYGYRWIVNKLQEVYSLDVEINSWNGGSNRAKYYFPLHYYPLKVLEAKGMISYFGRGSIVRLI